MQLDPSGQNVHTAGAHYSLERVRAFFQYRPVGSFGVAQFRGSLEGKARFSHGSE